MFLLRATYHLVKSRLRILEKESGDTFENDALIIVWARNAKILNVESLRYRNSLD